MEYMFLVSAQATDACASSGTPITAPHRIALLEVVSVHHLTFTKCA